MCCRHGDCGVLYILQAWGVSGYSCASGMGCVGVLHVLQAWGVWGVTCCAGMGHVGVGCRCYAALVWCRFLL